MRFIMIIMTLAIGSTRALPAQTYSRQLEGRLLEFEQVYYEDFEQGLDEWLPEGEAEINTVQGWLHIDARQGAVTIWCRKEFSGPQLVEYDVRLISDSFESNLNMFLLAGQPDAAGLLATTSQRNGDYRQYHQFPNYLVTILNGTSPDKREQLRVRMRLNPGFELVEEQWYEPLVFGNVYHIAYLIEPPSVTVLMNGKVIAKANCGKELSSGLHGLRIWRTHSIYDNFRVICLIGDYAPKKGPMNVEID